MIYYYKLVQLISEQNVSKRDNRRTDEESDKVERMVKVGGLQ